MGMLDLETREKIKESYDRYETYIVWGSVLVLMHGWFIAAAIINFPNSVALLVILGLFWLYVLGWLAYTKLPWGWTDGLSAWVEARPWLSTVFGVSSMVGLLALLIVFGWHSSPRLYSTGCLVLLVLVAVVLSEAPARIKWRPVVSGILLQYVLAFAVLKWNYGRIGLQWVVDQLVTFLGYAKIGTSFVFDYIPAPPDICGMEGPFAFTSLPILVYFAALCAVWYYMGLIQWVLRRVAVVLQLIMGTTAAESLNAVASSLMGPTEAAGLMRYALPTMTQSEIVVTMAVGSSMISGSLFAIYIAFGACAPMLLAANVMSAPATLLISKIVQPETQVSRQKDMSTFEFPPCEDLSILQAVSNGAISAIEVVLAIIANLIVYLAALAFVDAAIQYLTGLLGFQGITFEILVGYAFFPLAFLMGASAEAEWSAKLDETLKVAQLIGTKTVLNEFIGYQQMQGMLLRGEIHPRGQLIAVFAMCGYSNPSNIGSVLAQFVAMCPQRLKAMAAAAPKGLYIASLACFMTACVAGSLIDDDSLACMPDDPSENCLNLDDVVRYFNQTAF